MKRPRAAVADGQDIFIRASGRELWTYKDYPVAEGARHRAGTQPPIHQCTTAPTSPPISLWPALPPAS